MRSSVLDKRRGSSQMKLGDWDFFGFDNGIELALTFYTIQQEDVECQGFCV
jgi:hypothetical protein